ncbi:hypothetical protein B0H11DRAFT_1909794 [Mycena galericulata]|nr:hypothetical protein B0H11DRAFT_1909794 [Mycena galericulata]
MPTSRERGTHTRAPMNLVSQIFRKTPSPWAAELAITQMYEISHIKVRSLALSSEISSLYSQLCTKIGLERTGPSASSCSCKSMTPRVCLYNYTRVYLREIVSLPSWAQHTTTRTTIKLLAEDTRVPLFVVSPISSLRNAPALNRGRTYRDYVFAGGKYVSTRGHFLLSLLQTPRRKLISLTESAPGLGLKFEVARLIMLY